MMLVSKEIRNRLAVLVLGTSMIGCSSGPGTSFTRFWPGRNQEEAPVASAAKVDEDLAAKWRDRINETSSAENRQFQVAAAEPVAEKEEKSSRFNLLKKLPWSRKAEEEEVKQANLRAQADRERADLERKLAELEAEKRRLAAGGNRPAGARPQYGLDRKDELTDPFLAAERLSNKKSPSADIGKPADEKSLPAWARSGEVAPTTPVSPSATKSVPSEEVAVSGNNAFMPGFDETLKNLQATVAEQDAQKASQKPLSSPQSTAPAMPLDDPAPVVAQTEPKKELPLETVAPVATPVAQPQLEQPIADDSSAAHPLATNKSVVEQRRDWATLEVQQLMKRARIEARAEDYQAAVNSALEAEQLANNAKVDFAADEQTPWELISAIRNVTSASSSVAATPAPQPLPKEEVGRASVIVKPAVPPRPNTSPTQHSFIASRKQSHPLQSDQNLRRAQFLNPQPSLKPKTVAVPDWSSRSFANAAPEKKAVEPAPQAGHYMESPSTGPAKRGPLAQFVSSSNSGSDSNANIYSPENLQWTTLDATLATLDEQQRASGTVAPEPPQFAEAPAAPASDDPFAAFSGVEVEDAPLVAAAPKSSDSIPTQEEAAEAAQSTLIFGVPLRKLALVGLAGLIFLAAIIHRRRHNPLHL